MISRRRAVLALLVCVATLCSAEQAAGAAGTAGAAGAAAETEGLVHTESETDLVAEATQTGPAQKREAVLSNSYGEPLPADAYGPPLHIPDTVPELPQGSPAPVYGVPDVVVFPPSGPLQGPPPGPPAGTYGPPAPVSFPSQVYHGPPPPVQRPKPVYGPPKPVYGPPKPVYGPPKPVYGPPKPVYGPPKFSPPKKTYGPPKLSLPKPTYGVPFKPPKITLNKPLFSPPKPVYGPPKPVYGPPKPVYGPPPPRDPPALPLPELPQIPLPPLDNNNIDLGLNLPAPIYGTPLLSLPVDLKPNFPLPTDTYGPPGYPLGPVGPNDQLLLQNIGGGGHYGPPQPDPNPRPPHPGVPAPPTPPHVLYDGWKPIPGVSLPHGSVQGHISQQYGPPVQDLHINLEQNLPSLELQQQFSSSNHQQQQHHHQQQGAVISSGYSSVHHDALANIDLGAILGGAGESNHIDASNTVFEAHYTETQAGRQHAGKGLTHPSAQYGAPPPPPPRTLPGLPLGYGQHSGGGHSGGDSPRSPVIFRETVPAGLFEHIAHTTNYKDAHNIDHAPAGPAYLPPPIKSSAGHSVSLSIEPSNLYSLPHAGSPLGFQAPSNLYGSPIDSYAAPLLTVGGDHVTSDSNTNTVTSTLDGTLLANLSNLSSADAAAILKHCPYHEAILKAAQSGNSISRELATKYVNSLSSLGSTLKRENKDIYTPQKSKSLKEKHTVREEQLQQVSKQIQETSDRIRQLNLQAQQLQQNIVSSSQTLTSDLSQSNSGTSYSVQIQPSNGAKPSVPHDQLLSEGLLQSILQAIDDPSKAPQLAKQQQQNVAQQQITQNNVAQQNIAQHNFAQQQIQQQNVAQQQNFAQQNIAQPPQLSQQQGLPLINSVSSFNSNTRSESFADGIVLPAGYEPVDRSRDQLPAASTQHQHTLSDCELKAAASTRTESVVAPDTSVSRGDIADTDSSDTDTSVSDNVGAASEESEVRLYFGAGAAPVTEISVATSISEDTH